MSAMTGEKLEEYRASLALRHAPHLGPRTWKRLVCHFGNAGAAVDQVSRWMSLGLAGERQVRALRSGEWKEKAETEQQAAARLGLKAVLWTDPGYPALLREIADPPLYMYYRGRLELAAGPSLAVVGSRTCSAVGLAYAGRIGRDLSEAGLTVVSGMAWGIDRQAQLAALEGPGSSVAVLGTGIDVIYPRENKDLYKKLAARGLLLTEYPPETRPVGANFPRRNRIISGMSLGVLLVEAPLRSGGRITTSQALEQGREVYVVAGPDGRSTFAGCRELMEQGARSVTTAGEIILDLAPLLREELKSREKKSAAAGVQDAGSLIDAAMSPEVEKKSVPAPPQADLSDEEKAVISALDSDAGDGVHIDALGRSLGWPADKTSRTLLDLEIRGLVFQLPGMCYTANRDHV